MAGGFAGETTGTQGTAYGNADLEGPTDPQIVMPVGAESRSLALRAPEDNNGPVYIGWDDEITEDTGFPLYASDSISIDLDNTQQTVWAISEIQADQLRFILVE